MISPIRNRGKGVTEKLLKVHTALILSFFLVFLCLPTYLRYSRYSRYPTYLVPYVDWALLKCCLGNGRWAKFFKQALRQIPPLYLPYRYYFVKRTYVGCDTQIKGAQHRLLGCSVSSLMVMGICGCLDAWIHKYT
ncbi:hypothetical protein F4781DRAFT_386107 [Annulohypoxylon bovei var. microspora]|nr:hypothetical protein F4781DRAFT_386107 [Annulohypoxylon bovei var. microspora]